MYSIKIEAFDPNRKYISFFRVKVRSLSNCGAIDWFKSLISMLSLGRGLCSWSPSYEYISRFLPRQDAYLYSNRAFPTESKGCGLQNFSGAPPLTPFFHASTWTCNSSPSPPTQKYAPASLSYSDECRTKKLSVC